MDACVKEREKLFNRIVENIKETADTKVYYDKYSYEIGTAFTDNEFITYNEEEDAIKIYNNNNESFTITRDSYLLNTLKELMQED